MKLYEIRCPGTLVTKYNEVRKCNALLCKLSEGSKCEIICRNCKRKLTIVVKPGLGVNPEIAIRQDNSRKYDV